jgi:uncharacterized membrane protein
MKKQFLSPLLIIAAMILLIFSRIVSENGFDWLAVVASIILTLSVGIIIYEIIKLNNLK